MPAMTRRSAEAVMPVRGEPANRPDWARLGLPRSGWVLVTDLDQCALCPTDERPCADACASEHDLLPEVRRAMGACYHCDPAPCIDACPVNAVKRTEMGVVEVDQEECIGCAFCIDVCPTGALKLVDPFQVGPPAFVPASYEPGRPYGNLTGTAAKCTFCEYRMREGNLPICADNCPQGAIWVGNLDRNTATNGRSVVRLTELLGHRNFRQSVPGQRTIHLLG